MDFFVFSEMSIFFFTVAKELSPITVKTIADGFIPEINVV